MSNTLRLFWAVCPPDESIQEATALLRELKRPLAALDLSPAWVRGDGLHITLKFLGEVAEGDIGDMVAHVERELAAARATLTPAPQLQLGGLGLFAGPERPSVLFAGVLGHPGPPAELLKLQAVLEGWLEALGFAREARAYHPHLTLARIKHAPPDRDGRRTRALQQLVQDFAARRFGPVFPAAELCLYESQLGPQGARYVPIVRLPLAAPG